MTTTEKTKGAMTSGASQIVQQKEGSGMNTAAHRRALARSSSARMSYSEAIARCLEGDLLSPADRARWVAWKSPSRKGLAFVEKVRSALQSWSGREREERKRHNALPDAREHFSRHPEAGVFVRDALPEELIRAGLPNGEYRVLARRDGTFLLVPMDKAYWPCWSEGRIERELSHFAELFRASEYFEELGSLWRRIAWDRVRNSVTA